MKAKILYTEVDKKGNIVQIITTGGQISPQKAAMYGITPTKLKKYPIWFNGDTYPNTLTILTKYGPTVDNIIGCDVQIASQTLKLSLTEIAQRVKYLNCNYTVRQVGHKLVLAGNKGYSEMQIKFVRTHKAPTQTDLPTADTPITPKAKEQPVTDGKPDLLTILGTVGAVGGVVIIPEDHGYKAQAPKETEVGDAFINAHMGQVAKPTIKYSSKLNCSLLFQVPGYIQAKLSISDSPVKVPVHVYRNKIIYKDSIKPNIDRLMVAVPSTSAGALKQTLGEVLKADTTKDESVKQILQFAGKQTYACLELDLSKLDVMTVKTAGERLLSATTLRDLVAQTNEIKLVNTKLRTVKTKARELNKALETGPVYASIASSLRPFTTTIEDQQILIDLGIDLATGCYTETKRVYNKDSKPDKVTEPELKYDIALTGAEPKITKLTVAPYTTMLEIEKQLDKLKEASVLDYSELSEAVETLDDIDGAMKDRLNVITGALWNHKVASLHLGNKVHFYGTKQWQPVPSRATKNVKYINPMAPDLVVTVPKAAQF